MDSQETVHVLCDITRVRNSDCFAQISKFNDGNNTKQVPEVLVPTLPEQGKTQLELETIATV